MFSWFMLSVALVYSHTLIVQRNLSKIWLAKHGSISILKLECKILYFQAVDMKDVEKNDKIENEKENK